MDEDTIPDHISPHYTSVPLHVLRMCQELSEISMIDAFGKKPFPWQKAIITHLNLMTCPTSGIPPSPTFLCAPTGGGKSIARDSFAAGQGHVSWCISPLLSLGADQVIKINQNSASGDGAVVAFHLDHYRHRAQQQAIAERIGKITGDSNTTVCITSSPQALVNNKVYYALYCALIQKDSLKLLTVDELQLFVQFGRRFRNEFFALKEKVFAPLSLSGGKRTRIPILFMTATATTTILEQTTLLTGLIFCRRNIFWPGPSHMLQRRCQIEFVMTSQPFSVLTSIVEKLYKAMDEDAIRRQFVVFANFRNKVEEFSTRLKAYLDLKGHTGDVITVVGSQYKEQKMHHAALFLNDTPDRSRPVDNGVFDAIACLATRTIGAAGWDCRHIHDGMSPDFPTDICSIDQEKGRIGRRPGASTKTDHYVICGSLKSYVQLIARLWLPEDPDHTNADSAMGLDEYRTHCLSELHEVLDLFVLADDCLHSLLAISLSNPFLPISVRSIPLPPCPTDAPQCSYCNGSLASQFPKVVKTGVQSVLFDIFLGEHATGNLTLGDTLIVALRQYPSSNNLMFGWKANNKPEPRHLKKVVLLLLSAKILGFRIQFAEDDEDKKHPIVLARLLPSHHRIGLAIHSDEYWTKIRLRAS
jgi:hypothetical protein